MFVHNHTSVSSFVIFLKQAIEHTHVCPTVVCDAVIHFESQQHQIRWWLLLSLPYVQEYITPSNRQILVQLLSWISCDSSGVLRNATESIDSYDFIYRGIVTVWKVEFDAIRVSIISIIHLRCTYTAGFDADDVLCQLRPSHVHLMFFRAFLKW